MRSFFDRLAFAFLLVLIVAVPVSTALVEIAAIGLLISWLLTQSGAAYRRFWKALPLGLWLVLLTLAVWALSASAAGPSPAESLRACVTKWGERVFVFIAALCTLSSAGRARWSVRVLLLSSALIAADGFWQYFHGMDFLRGKPLLHGFYPTASFRYYTYYANYVMVLFLAGAGANLQTGISRLERAALTAHNAIFFLALVLCFSRGAWAGAAAGFALLSLTRERKLLWIAAAGLLCLVFFYPALLSIRSEKIFSAGWAGYRPEMWQAAGRMIQSHPWLGVGINNFERLIANYGTVKGYAHNGYLQFAAETGLPGIFFLVVWFAGVLKWSQTKLVQAASSDRELFWGIFAAVSGYLVHSAFDNFLHSVNSGMLLWLLLGILAAGAGHSAVREKTCSW